MPIDSQQLKAVPQTAAASRIKYIRNLDEDQLLQFYHGLHQPPLRRKTRATGRS